MWILYSVDDHHVEWVAKDEATARQLYSYPMGPDEAADPEWEEHVTMMFKEAREYGHATNPGDCELHYVPFVDRHNNWGMM
jgi:hypothetical protein